MTRLLQASFTALMALIAAASPTATLKTPDCKAKALLSQMTLAEMIGQITKVDRAAVKENNCA